jgi:hypothetical protein
MRPDDAFAIDAAATPERLAQAAAMLEHCTGSILFEQSFLLRPGAREIRCEVFDTTPAARRCEEEYKVMVENAARALDRSKLGALLPAKSLRWVVVEDRGSGVIDAWSA